MVPDMELGSEVHNANALPAVLFLLSLFFGGSTGGTEVSPGNAPLDQPQWFDLLLVLEGPDQATKQMLGNDLRDPRVRHVLQFLAIPLAFSLLSLPQQEMTRKLQELNLREF